VRHLGICEQAGGHEPVFGRAIAAREVIADDSEIVERSMSELRTAGTLLESYTK
jgi:hypothetical protein